jgi:hypothetical protein
VCDDNSDDDLEVPEYYTVSGKSLLLFVKKFIFSNFFFSQKFPYVR